MARNYERMDFTYLLDELQGNTVLSPIEEAVQLKVVDSRPQIMSVIEEDTMMHEDSLVVVSEMIQHVIKPYDVYLTHVENVLDLFKALEAKSIKNYKKIQNRFGFHEKSERSRIITWLNEIKTAIKQGNDSDVEFFCNRLYEKTGFCDYVKNYLGIDSIEMVIDRPIVSKPESAKLHRIFSDEKIKFVYSDKTLRIHDKLCQRVKNMDDDEIHSSEEYLTSFTSCPQCEIKAYIRAGAKDIKEYEKYIKLFELMGADKDTIKRMYVDLKFKTQISHMHTEGYKYSNLTENAITIWYKEDTWRIGITDKNQVRLEHNNYKKLKGGLREFVPGFHIQSDRTHSTSLNYALGVIRDYRYSSHFEMPVEKSKATIINIPKAHEYVPKNADEFKYVETPSRKSLKERVIGFLRRTLFRDQLHNAKKYTKDNRPNNNELCLYLWEDENGNKHWSSGRYLYAKQQFSVSYEDQKVTTSIDKVIKWVPLDEINAI